MRIMFGDCVAVSERLVTVVIDVLRSSSRTGEAGRQRLQLSYDGPVCLIII